MFASISFMKPSSEGAMRASVTNRGRTTAEGKPQMVSKCGANYFTAQVEAQKLAGPAAQKEKRCVPYSMNPSSILALEAASGASMTDTGKPYARSRSCVGLSAQVRNKNIAPATYRLSLEFSA